jgi:hypothetical protein
MGLLGPFWGRVSRAGASGSEAQIARRFRRKPMPIPHLVTKPRQLSFGIAARVHDRTCRGLIERDFAIEMASQPRHAVRFCCGQCRVEVAFIKRPHLFKHPCFQHRFKPRLNTADQFLAFACNKQFGGVLGVYKWRQTFSMPLR